MQHQARAASLSRALVHGSHIAQEDHNVSGEVEQGAGSIPGITQPPPHTARFPPSFIFPAACAELPEYWKFSNKFGSAKIPIIKK